MMNQNNCPGTSRMKLMQFINEISFAVDDIQLYLDTHPNDEKALEFFRTCDSKRREALRQYAQNYGPLTIDTADDCVSKTWEWIKQPFPWEKEGACC